MASGGHGCTCGSALTAALVCYVRAGTFGRVLECWDRKHKDYVAVKIVRNVDKYRHAAMIEVCSLVAWGTGAQHCCTTGAIAMSLVALLR